MSLHGLFNLIEYIVNCRVVRNLKKMLKIMEKSRNCIGPSGKVASSHRQVGRKGWL